MGSKFHKPIQKKTFSFFSLLQVLVLFFVVVIGRYIMRLSVNQELSFPFHYACDLISNLIFLIHIWLWDRIKLPYPCFTSERE